MSNFHLQNKIDMKGNESKKIRVLIAEDSFLVREMIQGLLEDLNYAIAGTAKDGFQAVQKTEALRPDVVLMDIKMPKLDGIEASQQIFIACPTPIVMLTAFESPELVHRASQAGIGAYLVKPPHAADLDRAIIIAMARFHDLIEFKRLNKELEQRNHALEEAIGQIKTLSGLLPICASCKNIRDDEGYWHAVEVYIREHTDVKFSHAVCPDCAKKLYPDIYEKWEEEGRL